MTVPCTGPSEESLRQERAKWDAFYTEHPQGPEDAATRDFNDRLAADIATLLPAGSRILEAGCGSGSASLALARLGRYDIHLMDFAEAALRCAVENFRRADRKAQFFAGDIFQQAEPHYDLVFNAGSLEHYAPPQQAAFLRGLASRSRRYVLVLVPNNLSYWYWIWRIRGAAQGYWAFGKEVPVSDLAEVFQEAGLRFLGGAFLGQTWTEDHIRSLGGLPADLCEDILRIHRGPVIPAEQKAYLYAALGTVDPDAAVAEGSIFLPARSPRTVDAPQQAMLADLLAAQIAGLARQRELTQQLAQRQEQLQRSQAELARREQQHDQQHRRAEELQLELARLEQQHDQQHRRAEELQLQLARLEQQHDQQHRRAEELQARQQHQQQVFEAQIAQREQTCRQIEQQLRSVEQELLRQQQAHRLGQEQLHAAQQDLAQRNRDLLAAGSAAAWTRRLAADLAQQIANIRVSRRYKFGNILSAFKQRPLRGLWVAMKWSVGRYRARGMGLAAALDAPDLLAGVQRSLQDLGRQAAQAPAPGVARATPDPVEPPDLTVGTVAAAAARPGGPPVACLVKDFCDGGAERVVMDLCTSLQEAGRAAQVLVVGQAGRCATEARRRGIEVIEVHEAVEALERHLDRQAPRVVLAHHCYFGLESLRRRGIPLIEVLHSAYYYQKGERPLAELRKRCVDRYIAVSGFVREYCASQLGIPRERIELIPNGLNPVGLIRPPLELLAARRMETIASPLVIHVANVYPSKNHRLAVRAFAGLVRDYPRARLLICGAADYNPDLADAVIRDIASLGIGDNITWCGSVDRRGLSRLLAQAHLAILPSLFEGFSIASLEYAYFGLPTILSGTGAAVEFLGRYGHGLIAETAAIPPGDLSNEAVDARCREGCEQGAEQVRRQMADILSDYPAWTRLACGAAARSDEYGVDAVVGRYLEVMDRYV